MLGLLVVRSLHQIASMLWLRRICLPLVWRHAVWSRACSCSLRTACEIDGSVELYDRLERIAFNSMPATTDQYFGGNAYYHSINQVPTLPHDCWKDSNPVLLGTHVGERRFRDQRVLYGQCASGRPKFIMSQVQTVHNDPSTVVVSGYSPHYASLNDHSGTVVTIAGQYPFADNATISVKRTPGESWGVWLRIPCWVEAATVFVDNTQSMFAAQPCGFFKVPGLEPSSVGVTATVSFVQAVKV